LVITHVGEGELPYTGYSHWDARAAKWRFPNARAGMGARARASSRTTAAKENEA